MDAPLARSLLGKRLDDEVTVLTPKGERTWVITEVRYETP
jgi:transcription elongation factor GreB